MRLVVSYTEGDGCTYSCQNTIPVVCESAEQLLLDIEAGVASYLEQRQRQRQQAAWDSFEKKWRGHSKAILEDEYWDDHEKIRTGFPSHEPTLQVGGSELYLNHFIEDGKFYAPVIYTVDEWFDAAERGELT